MNPASCIVSQEVLDKHGIRKLPYFPAFDRVLVFQLADAVSDKVGEGSLLYKPPGTKARQEKEECRGVLLAAGAAAMDHLRAHGMEVGDVVWFSRLAIWRHVAGTVDGKDIEMMFLRSADLAGSEGHLQRVLAGEAKMVREKDDGLHEWLVDGVVRKRAEPAVDEY